MDEGNQNTPIVNAPSSNPAPAQPAAPAPAPSVPCKCPTINPADWDKKRQKISKIFHKTFSPRLFYYPFSFVIDVDRATRGAIRKGYKVVENGMLLDNGGMFWGSVFVEVTNANLQDKDVVSFENKEVYTKISRNPWNQIKNDIEELTKELGTAPLELYVWWTSCPKCVDKREVKSILIAVTAQSIPEQQTQQPAAVAETPKVAEVAATPPVAAEQQPQAPAPAEPQQNPPASTPAV